jgi:hypothetical protein
MASAESATFFGGTIGGALLAAGATTIEPTLAFLMNAGGVGILAAVLFWQLIQQDRKHTTQREEDRKQCDKEIARVEASFEARIKDLHSAINPQPKDPT